MQNTRSSKMGTPMFGKCKMGRTFKRKNENENESEMNMPMMPNIIPMPPMYNPELIKIESAHHSLFIEQMRDEMNLIPKQNDEDPDLFYRTGAYRKYTLYLNEFSENEKGLHEIFQALRDSEEDDMLEIRINSPGGYLSELIEFYNTIKSKFYGRTMTVLSSYGYSCGALIMVMGDKRVASEFSEIMFHQASFGAFGPSSSVTTQVSFTEKQCAKFVNSIMKPFFTTVEINDMLQGKDYWLGAEEMASRGIATEVMVDGIELSSEDYLKLLKWEKENPEENRNTFFDALFAGEFDPKEEEVVEKKPKKKAPVKKATAKKVDKETTK